MAGAAARLQGSVVGAAAAARPAASCCKSALQHRTARALRWQRTSVDAAAAAAAGAGAATVAPLLSAAAAAAAAGPCCSCSSSTAALPRLCGALCLAAGRASTAGPACSSCRQSELLPGAPGRGAERCARQRMHTTSTHEQRAQQHVFSHAHTPACSCMPLTCRTPESEALSKALKAAGMKFVGPTTMYAFIQVRRVCGNLACGNLVIWGCDSVCGDLACARVCSNVACARARSAACVASRRQACACACARIHAGTHALHRIASHRRLPAS